MFGKMRLLVGCRSGMTVKFASKFHHGNPFVRGLLFAGSAVPFRGHCAVRRWCGIGCVRPLWGAAQSMRICATLPLRERHRHVQRREAVAQGSCESDFPALPAAQTCQGHSLRGVVSPQCTQRAFAQHCSLYLLRSTVGERGRKITPLSDLCPAVPALHLLVCQVLFQYVAALKEGGCQVRQTDGV